MSSLALSSERLCKVMYVRTKRCNCPGILGECEHKALCGRPAVCEIERISDRITRERYCSECCLAGTYVSADRWAAMGEAAFAFGRYIHPRI